MQSNWEEAHSQALREYLVKGMSFAEIAHALNERFGTSYSRNAAIGRARRMGLSTPEEKASRPAHMLRRPDAARLHKSRAASLVPPRPKLAVFERAAALNLRCVAVKPRHLALVDLEANDCRYPYGGDAEGEPITFCGHPRREGSSYCVSHFHLTSLQEPAREQRPARAPLRLVEAA